MHALRVLLAVTLFATIGCGRGDEPTSAVVPEASARARVYVVTDQAGPGDGGFNDVCLAGVARAREEFGIHDTLLHSRQRADFETNLMTAARKGEVVVVGDNLAIRITDLEKPEVE